MTTTEDRSDRRIVWARDEGLHRWVPNLLALLVAIVGINDVTLSIGRIHRHVHQVSTILPLAWEHAAVAASIAGGLVLLLVARGLHRRKRRAWTLAVAVMFRVIGTPPPCEDWARSGLLATVNRPARVNPATNVL